MKLTTKTTDETKGDHSIRNADHGDGDDDSDGDLDETDNQDNR